MITIIITTMLDDFLIRAVLAGLGVALAAAPMGCFVVWRRMAYMGDATAHAAILGVALSLSLSISVTAGILVIAVAMALTVHALTGRGHSADALLGVLAHGALAFGLVAVSFLDGVRIDLMAYLFGDILTVDLKDLAIIWGGALLTLSLVILRWSALLTATVNPDLARASGLDPKREELILTLVLAVIIAISIKIVGILLIAALLIIPAAAARPLSRTPEIMAIIAVVIAVLSVLAGLQASLSFDTQAGPSIVSIAAVLFAVTHVISRILRL